MMMHCTRKARSASVVLVMQFEAPNACVESRAGLHMCKRSQIPVRIETLGQCASSVRRRQPTRMALSVTRGP